MYRGSFSESMSDVGAGIIAFAFGIALFIVLGLLVAIIYYAAVALIAWIRRQQLYAEYQAEAGVVYDQVADETHFGAFDGADVLRSVFGVEPGSAPTRPNASVLETVFGVEMMGDD